jgi:hypothetical protein
MLEWTTNNVKFTYQWHKAQQSWADDVRTISNVSLQCAQWHLVDVSGWNSKHEKTAITRKAYSGLRTYNYTDVHQFLRHSTKHRFIFTISISNGVTTFDSSISQTTTLDPCILSVFFILTRPFLLQLQGWCFYWNFHFILSLHEEQNKLHYEKAISVRHHGLSPKPLYRFSWHYQRRSTYQQLLV